MGWLEKLLETDVADHGVHQGGGKAFFRLPSSGLLVKTFYSFGRFLCNQENCARIGWMLYQLILEIEKEKDIKIQWLVAVTRSSSPLAQRLLDNYLNSRGPTAPQPLFASTVEDLERQSDEKGVSGAAIFLTDVFSTGKMSMRVGRALRSVKWFGTIAVLDTRSDTHRRSVLENAGPAQGIN
jgi:hypothetical protein